MESDPMNSFFGKSTEYFQPNKKHELPTLTEDSLSLTSFQSLTENDSSLGDTRWWDDFGTSHLNVQIYKKTKDNLNSSNILINELNTAPEKENLDLDLTLAHQRDHYNKISGTSRANQDVTDGLAYPQSKPISEVLDSYSVSSLYKQIDNLAVGSADTKKVVFGDYTKVSVNMRDQEFVSASDDGNMCRISQDISDNNGHGLDSISSEFGTVENDTTRSYLSEFSLSLKPPTYDNNDISMQSQQEASSIMSKMTGDENIADVAPDVIGTFDLNQNTTIDTLDKQASKNVDINTTSTHCEDQDLIDHKVLSPNSPVNSRTRVITLTQVEDHSEEPGIGGGKIQEKESFVEVHCSNPTQKTEIQITRSDIRGSEFEFSKDSEIFDTKPHATSLSKPGNSDSAPLEPVPSGDQLENEVMRDYVKGKRRMREEGWNIKMQDRTDKLVGSEEKIEDERMVENIKKETTQENPMIEHADTSSVINRPDDSSPEKTTVPPLGSESNQSVQSPTAVKERPLHLSFLFPSMRGTKKEGHEERETPDQPQSPNQSNKEVKGDFLEQITQFFNSSKGEGKRKKETTSSPPLSPVSQKPAERPKKRQTEEEKLISPSEETNKAPNTETALDAFKAFFTVKPVRKDTSLQIDMDAGKKKMNKDKEALRAFFDRSSIKSPDTKRTDCKV